MLLTAYASAPETSAESYVLFSADTGEVICGKNENERLGIASITKVMTALVVCENCRLDEMVTVKAEYTGIEGSSMYLKAGEQLTVRELLYGLLLASGNDAATALACHCAGSVTAFAQLMNDKALELGLENTHFDNPHGLTSDTHYSSAYDMAVIAAAAMQQPAIRAACSSSEAELAGRRLENHNRLLGEYEGAMGLKTGYTMASGRTLISFAQRGGLGLVAVTLNDPDDWEDHAALLDYGFANYELIFDSNTAFTSVEVVSGSVASVGVVPDESFGLMPGHGQISIDVELPDFVYAPVAEGSVAGRITVYEDGQQIFETQLRFCSGAQLDKSQLLSFWERLKKSWYLANEYGGISYQIMY